MRLNLDACYRNRYEDPLEEIVPVFYIAVFLNVTYSLFLFLKTKRSVNKAMEILHVWGFYISGAMIVFALKTLLKDKTCSLKPNSVSGHTYYNIYFIIASWVLFKSDKVRREFSLFILLLALNFCLCANICVTYFGGYHTIRQMTYGAVCAIIAYSFYHLVSKLRQNWNLLTILGVGILITTFFGLFIGGNISFMGYSPVIIWYICYLLVLRKVKSTPVKTVKVKEYKKI